jgi:class 3 adenylate cyclase/CHASE2 domain-containing sensor protein
MSIPWRKCCPYLVAGTVILLLTCLQLIPYFSPDKDVFQRLKWITYDWRVRLAAQYSDDHQATNQFAAVLINERSWEWLKSGDAENKALLEKQRQWPVPRQIHGRVVRELTAQGVKSIAFDIIFDRKAASDSPVVMDLEQSKRNGFTEAMLAQYQSFTETNQPTQYIVESDDFFGAQMRLASNVVLASTEGLLPAESFLTNAATVGIVEIHKDYDGICRRIKAYEDIKVWHPLILQSAINDQTDIAKIRVETNRIIFPMPDGTEGELELDAQGCFEVPVKEGDKEIVRREKPYRVVRIWHLGIAMAARALNLDLEHPVVEKNQIILKGPGVERILPVDDDGNLYVDWCLPTDDQHVFMTEDYGTVLRRDIKRQKDPASLAQDQPLKGKSVVIGSVMKGNNMMDFVHTPLSGSDFGVSTHWNVANSVMLNRFIKPSPIWLDLMINLIFAVLASVFAWQFRVGWSILCVISLGVAYTLLSAVVFVQYRCWLPMVLPFLSLLAAFLALVAYRVIFEQQERRRVKGVFSKLVSPDVVNELLSTENLKLDGSRREVTVYFADVRGFTEMTDLNQVRAEEYVRAHNLQGDDAKAHFDQQAADVLRTVNLYLKTIADVVKTYHGTLDKYIGDCVMAFWGAPIWDEKHALNCVLAAVESQRAIYRLSVERTEENRRREKENEHRIAQGQEPLSLLPVLSLGTGVNTGMVTVGLMGSDAHIFNYTIFGREVNVASRLEGVSGRGRVIIGPATYEQLKKHDPALAATCVALDPVKVKGIREAVAIYEVPWRLPDMTMQF